MTLRYKSGVRFFIMTTLLLVMIGEYYLAFSNTKGMDFPVFYAAAHMVRDGAARHLYDYQTQDRFKHETGLIFEYPPIAALLYLPSATFSLKRAFLTWTCVCMMVLLVCAGLLNGALGTFPHTSWFLLLSLLFIPLNINFLQGQPAIFMLLIYTLCFVALKHDKELLAGCALAGGLLKFPLVMPFLLMQLLRKRWRFIAGFAITALPITLISVFLIGWDGASKYIGLLVHPERVPGIDPRSMANLRGLYVVIARHEPPFLGLAIVSFLLLLWGATSDWARLEREFAAGIVLTILVSYHSNPHDLTLLLLPLAATIKGVEWRSFRGIIFLLVALPPLYVLLLAVHEFALMSVPLLLFLISEKSHCALVDPGELGQNRGHEPTGISGSAMSTTSAILGRSAVEPAGTLVLLG